jgi:predicted RNA binding protein YcfA (HicA-like mRNA interferase family)
MPDVDQILGMLDRDQALELGPANLYEGAAGAWPVIGGDETMLDVDYGRLFPGRRPGDRGQADFELYGDHWDLTDEDAASIADEIGLDPSESRFPEWDVWAWYQPIHFFGPDWGIYIRETGLIECAQRIARSLPAGLRGAYRVSLLAKSLVRAAFSALFLHEQYHHKTESLALRLHVVERRPIYPAYHRLAYTATAGTRDQIEEGLANADSWERIDEDAYVRWTGLTVTRTAREYLARSFQTAPPGYANAARLLTKPDFDAEQQLLFTRVQEGLAPTRRATSDFGVATHLNQSLFRVSQRIWTIIPAGGRSILPTRPSIAPLKTARLERVIRHDGWEEVPGSGKGSHRKFRDSNGRMIILPKSKDVSMTVLKTTATALGVSVRRLSSLARER